MVNKEVYQKIATDIKSIDEAMANAQDLISAVKEVGEDVTSYETTLKELARKKVKWERVLKSRGF